MTKRRVCVIGCGAAGLASAKRISEHPELEVTVYEQTDRLGGTWVYMDTVGTEKNGLPVHTSMYKGLRTNLPKEVMGFPDYPIPEQERSYIKAEDILAFLESYSDHFNLQQYIKFNHHVKKVAPLDGGRWEVTVVDMTTGQDIIEEFDAVMVCNGHYHTPMYPNLKGAESFTGVQMHSHDYREPSCFKSRKVVVIGAGPSGIDLSIEASTTASHVILSKRDEMIIEGKFPERIEQRQEIIEIEGSKITFKDGTTTEADMLFYCTGYKYNFPFLTPDCGVRVEENAVRPLYKHLMHIYKPTMCFIGLPYYVCAFSLFDLQVRFFLKFLDGWLTLPSEEEMEDDTRREAEDRKNRGMKNNQFHMMGPLQGRYYDELSDIGGLEPIPPVMAKLHTDTSDFQLLDLVNFREHNYRIVDRENYIKLN